VVFVPGIFTVWSTVFAEAVSLRESGTLAALPASKGFAAVYRLAGLERVACTLYIVNGYGYMDVGRLHSRDMLAHPGEGDA